MAEERSEIRGSNGEGRAGRPVVRPIASGDDWSVCEFVCGAGPSDRPYEERHEGFTIAAVVQGSFTYRADSGAALLHPGSLLLGNSGKCFECGHEHGVGDRCIAFNFSQPFFGEIAATVAGTSRFAFSAPMLPAVGRSIPVVALAEALALDATPLHIEEAATRLLETVVAAFSGAVRSPSPPSRRETLRIAEALRHIEAHAVEPLTLAVLAELANFSKYHFLRVFRDAVGMTPYQYVLSARMRQAAGRLARSSEAVSTIALESGFGDLSTFNARFRNVFGLSPSAYRSAQVGGRAVAKPQRKRR